MPIIIQSPLISQCALINRLPLDGFVHGLSASMLPSEPLGSSLDTQSSIWVMVPKKVKCCTTHVFHYNPRAHSTPGQIGNHIPLID